MRLAEIIIENYRGIGEPLRIKINDIVVLIGNNNIGKTTVLSAYEAFATVGHQLKIADFHEENQDNTPTITGIFIDIIEGELADKWIHNDSELGYARCIKVQYKWLKPDIPGVKYSFSGESHEYVQGGTGGFESILASKIPAPLKITPTDNPTVLEGKILSILTDAIKENMKTEQSSISGLLTQIETLANDVRGKIEDDLQESTGLIALELQKIFPEFNHVEIDVKSGKIEPEKLISSGSFIRIGNKAVGDAVENHSVPLSHHGTGLQRTFLWAALKMLADTGRHKIGRSSLDTSRSKILLIEEPEAFLHPAAIREAREALYAIAKLANWQVMTTTHSPVFIDLSKDHTTIIRLEKSAEGIRSVKTLTTEEVGFTKDDKENLKMLNFCNPYINEFFFAEHNLLVEGETEYSVIKLLISEGIITKPIHVINCIGKANIVTISKILNSFLVPYSVLHDSDNPTIIREKKKTRNGAWTINKSIIEEVTRGQEKGIDIKTFISIPHFEGEYLNNIKGSSKPYEAWKYFKKEDNENTKRFISLLKSVVGLEANIADEQYSVFGDIEERVKKFIDESSLQADDKWDLDYYNNSK